MAGCDADELAAMMAHEAAHVAARDNLTRLLFAGAPVVPFAARAFLQMESAWVAASEEAADDAARRDERSAVALASALTKVARMASGRVPLLHASAILSGSSVEHRVRRLLEVAPDAPQARSRFVLPVVAMMGALVVAAGSPVLRVAYDIAEYCVRHLP
jgi:beta-lactamase regulating signal transducer with metallopeptidase domain